MTHDELVALGKRAVACKGWRWLCGMTGLCGGRVVQTIAGDALFSSGDAPESNWWGKGDEIPDLSDAATCGCLLALVREAWGDERIHCAPALHGAEPEAYRNQISHWHCFSAKSYTTPETSCAVVGWSEAGALVAALESAP